MSHPAQRAFFARLKEQMPQFFAGVRVLDCGSLDVNGSLRDLFVDSRYIGVDVKAGKGVDIVSTVHTLDLGVESFDVVVSAEMLEHDEYWRDSLLWMYALLKRGGLLAISAAGEGRPEHGTAAVPDDGHTWGTSPDYYRNLTPADLESVFGFRRFEVGEYEVNTEARDLYFWGIKA